MEAIGERDAPSFDVSRSSSAGREKKVLAVGHAGRMVAAHHQHRCMRNLIAAVYGLLTFQRLGFNPCRLPDTWGSGGGGRRRRRRRSRRRRRAAEGEKGDRSRVEAAAAAVDSAAAVGSYSMDGEDIDATRDEDDDIGIVKKEPEEENDIKDFAETTMNELLGWYGYDKVDSHYTQGLNLNRFTTSNKEGSNDSKLSVIDPALLNGNTCGTENSSGLDSPTGGSCSGGGSGSGTGGRTSCSTPPQSQASPNLPNGYVVCAWCQKVGMKLFTLRTNNGVKAFCSELCFTQCRRASFKKYKVCDWCKHIRHTVNYVDFQDGEQQLQFCSDKCLNQYKMNIFCRETQAHLQMHPHLRDAASKLTAACSSAVTSGSGGATNAANLTLITPDLWLRDCKGHDYVNGYGDDPQSGGESGGDKSDGTSKNRKEGCGSGGATVIEANSHSATSGKMVGSDRGSGGKENAIEATRGSHRHSRFRERERKRHRHQPNRGSTRSPPLLDFRREHRHHSRHFYEKCERVDKPKCSGATTRSSKSVDVTAATCSTPSNGTVSSLTNSVPSLRLTNGSPTSISSLNIPAHAPLPTGMLTSALASSGSSVVPPPSSVSVSNDLSRPPVPVISPQSLFLPSQPLEPIRLPPIQGIRPHFPFVLPPGMQLPPSLMPFLASHAHGPPTVTPPSAAHPLPPPPPPPLPHPSIANSPLSSLLPPVTVMVPYPVIVPVPIPIPIPIPLPIPMRSCKIPPSDAKDRPTSVTPVSPPASWNPENRDSDGSASCDQSQLEKKSIDDHSPPTQRTQHPNPSKRVDSVITRLVNSRMSQIYPAKKADDLRTSCSKSDSVTLAPFCEGLVPARVKEEPLDDAHSPPEPMDRSTLSETVHTRPGSNPSSTNTANHFAESAEEEDGDSFSCPGSEVDSDGSYSTGHSDGQREVATSTAFCDGLTIPTSPTSRLRHHLMPVKLTVDDQEPDMKRKCLRTRLVAK